VHSLSYPRLPLPDVVSSDRVRLLNRTLAEPSIEPRKPLRMSRKRRRYEKRCREKSAHECPEFFAKDHTYAQGCGMASSGYYNSAVTET
jgi:hypothetical protein